MKTRSVGHGYLVVLCFVAAMWDGKAGPHLFLSPFDGRAPNKTVAISGETGVAGAFGKELSLPLKPDRRIEFKTEEGTWISLDVSPRDESILFELLGHLYLLPIGGGDARPLTSGMSFDSQPRYSPDGSHIVFVSDRGGADNLWIADSDGSHARALTFAEGTMFISPTWTPDGGHIVVSRQDPHAETSFSELCLYDIAGGSGIAISNGKANALGAVVSRDGRYLYYARNAKLNDYVHSALDSWQIARRDSVTGREETITQEPGGAMRPALSPDGTKLLYGTRFHSQTGLRLRDLKTGETRWFVYPIDRDQQEVNGVISRDLLPGYAFTPRGNQVLVAYSGKLHQINLETGHESVVPFSAKVSQEIGPILNFPVRMETGPVRARVIQNTSYSPDGKRIAFSAFAHLYWMSLADRVAKRVTVGDVWEFEPAWSPDGKWLAYVTWTDQGGSLWKVRTDGIGMPQRLTTILKYYTDPVWSPDGSKVFVVTMPWQDHLEQPDDFLGISYFPNRYLAWIPSDGGDDHLIIPQAWAAHLHFSRENDRIYFTVPTTATSVLVSVRFDGTERQTRLGIKGKSFGYDPMARNTQIVLSPDGTHALVLFRDQLYVLRVPPPVAGEAPTIDIASPQAALSKISTLGADYASWSDAGGMITWTLGSTLYQRPLAAVRFPGETAKPRSAPPRAVEEAAGSAREADSLAGDTIPVIVTRPRYKPEGAVVLRGGRIVTMRGDEVLHDADLLIVNNRIAGVGRRGSVALPERVQTIDIAGTTVVPGFIDTHDHWTLMRHELLEKRDWIFLTNLAFGVTTGRDPQTITNDIFTYQDLEETGDLLSPRLFSTGQGIYWLSDFQSQQDAVDLLTRYRDFYGTHTVKNYELGNRRQRQWMVEACKQLQLMPTTEGAGDPKLVLTHFIDGFAGTEHNFPIVPLYMDVIQLVAHSNTFYDPTLLMTYGGLTGTTYFIQTTNPFDDPKVQRFYPHSYVDWYRRMNVWALPDEYNFREIAESVTKVVHAGGHVSVGSHGNFEGLGFQWALWALASGGLSPHEVLRLATIRGAEAIGYGQDLGSIEIGKLADLIVLNRNPLEDIHNTAAIRYVMKNGVLYEGDTLEEVWPQKKALPLNWWLQIERSPN